jgi:hypothetical protein
MATRYAKSRVIYGALDGNREEPHSALQLFDIFAKI